MLQAVIIWFVLCWVLWAVPFVRRGLRMPAREPAATDTRARWGILFQVSGYVVGFIWASRPHTAAMAASMICGSLGVWLGWAAVRHLGLQWRIDAGLFEDHALVRTGPYRWVRHPIYTSMILMYLEGALLNTNWLLAAAGFVLLLVGTEIRVRTEDGLLAGKFGAEFQPYRREVPAYLPFLR